MNGAAYVFSGASATPPRFAKLDLTTLTWTTLSVTGGPTTRWDYYTLVKGDYIYFIGGSNSTTSPKDIWRYDTITSTWLNTGNLFVGVSYGEVMSWKGELYYLKSGTLYHHNLETNVRTAIASISTIGYGADFTEHSTGIFAYGGELTGTRRTALFLIT